MQGSKRSVEEGAERDQLRRLEQEMEGPRARHGFRFCALACDFLCQKCQAAFQALNIDRVDDTAVANWCAQMLCTNFPQGEISAKRAFLKLEQRRLITRSSMMLLATRALSGGEQRDAFEEFKHVDVSCFLQGVCAVSYTHLRAHET